MTTFKYCATGLFALAALIGTAQAKNIAWFTENTTSVTKALGAAGVSDDGTWSTAGTLSESLSVGTGEQAGKVCVDTDGENRLTYAPKFAMNGNTASVKFENVCFTAPVKVDNAQLNGVQAAVAIVNDPDDGLVFKVANDGEWVTWSDAGTPTATDAYTVTCTFDYNAGTVTYVLGTDAATACVADIPSALQSTKVSTMEFEGTCTFTSLAGEKEAATYTLTLPAVTGIASYTVGEETKASGDWTITEGATPTVTVTLADGYFAKGTSITLPAVAGDVQLTAAQVTEAMELVEGEAMIGAVTYKTLQDAADAVANGATIKVRRNVETKDTLTFTNKTDITFDLNGKTVSYTNTNYAVQIFDTTIMLNSSAAGGRFEKPSLGTLVLVGSGRMDHGRIATATVTIDGGTWYCASAEGSCFKIENGTVDLTGGVIEHAVMAENLDQVAFNVTTNDQLVVSTLDLNGGIIKGYIARNAAATQTYDDDCGSMFSIKQDELCKSGYEMTKGVDDDYYTIQEKAGYTLSLTLNANVTKVVYAIDGGASVTNVASESGIEVDNGATVSIIEVCYAEGYTRPASGDKKSSEKTVASANIAFEFSAAVYEAGADLPSDVTPAEVGITDGAFKDAQPGEVNKVVKWASTKGYNLSAINAMDFVGELTESEKAYLLNCSAAQLSDELEAFKVASITFDADGKPVIPEGVEGKTYNGTIKKQGSASIATPNWVDISDSTEGYNFFRFLLVK